MHPRFPFDDRIVQSALYMRYGCDRLAGTNPGQAPCVRQEPEGHLEAVPQAARGVAGLPTSDLAMTSRWPGILITASLDTARAGMVHGHRVSGVRSSIGTSEVISAAR